IAAIDGNVIIDAGRTYQQTGSNLVAGMGADSSENINDALDNSSRGNTVIRAQDINIDNVMDVYTNQSEQKFKQSGFTVAVSNSLIDSAKSIDSLVTAGGDTQSTRMKGMAGVAAALKTKALAAEANSAGYDLLDGNLKGVGTTRIQATWGTSKSQSNSSSYTEANQGSSITTNNLALIATGAGTDSNIDINGSNLNVTNDALFQADNDLNINGVAQNSNTRSDNKSSSAAIGGFADTTGSAGITVSASGAKGYANSDSTTYANSQINVGGTTTLDIGNDLSIKGGVINTNRAQGTIGGNTTIESLQDTATYDSDQKNIGFSADIDIAGGGAGSSLSVNGGKTNVDADYQAVGEQSGIFTGDGGLDLTTEGTTNLIGGAITTTDKALQNGLNNYVSKGGITTQDIENTTSYEGDAISVGVSIGNTTGKPQATMNGIGYGTDGDSDSSVTRAGITGISGNKDITTDNRAEYAGILENVFDANRVNEELGAQTKITQEFGKEAPKAVGDFASKREESLTLNGDFEEAKKWGDGGAYRVALHTLVGALGTGSVEGAFASGTTAVSIPAVRQYLDKQGVDETTQNALLLGLSAGIGATVGGDTASTVTSFNQTDNNYLRHNDIVALGENINRALVKGDDAEVKRLLDKAILLSAKLNLELIEDNVVYVDAFVNQPTTLLDSNTIKNFLNGLNIPAEYQPKVAKILALQSKGQSTYDANRNKLIGENTKVVSLYPYESGYGEVPKSYNTSKEKVKTLLQDRSRGANALAGMGNSPVAAGAYLSAILAGASQEKAENIAIGTALGTTTLGNAVVGKVAVTGSVAINKQVAPLQGSKVTVTGQKIDNKSVTNFKSLTVDLRSKLPSRLKNSGNFGAAVIDVPGVQPLMAASSGLQAKDIKDRPTLVDKGFVVEVENPTFAAFTVNNSSGRPINRSVDTENKILNNIAAQLGNNTNAKGTVNLFTEREPCLSCSMNISQFKQRYPNVQLNIIDSGGNLYTPKNAGR
uniref:deaminase domain-containing protein n=1 Tax=Psychrobacter sp. TaxID=56811 RepID=UPI0035633D10